MKSNKAIPIFLIIVIVVLLGLLISQKTGEKISSNDLAGQQLASPGGKNPPPIPCTLTSYYSTPKNPVSVGENDTAIVWTTTNCTSVSIDNGVGSVATSGSYPVPANALPGDGLSAYYTITGSGLSGAMVNGNQIGNKLRLAVGTVANCSPATNLSVVANAPVNNYGSLTTLWTPAVGPYVEFLMNGLPYKNPIQGTVLWNNTNVSIDGIIGLTGMTTQCNQIPGVTKIMPGATFKNVVRTFCDGTYGLQGPYIDSAAASITIPSTYDSTCGTTTTTKGGKGH